MILINRNFKPLDNSRACEDAGNLYLEQLYVTDDIDAQVDLFNIEFNKLFDKHVPLSRLVGKKK